MDVYLHYLGDLIGEKEYNAAEKAGFIMSCNLDTVPEGSVVVPRHTVQSWNYEEYLTDLNTRFKSDLSLSEYLIYTDIVNWYPVLKDYTFPTFFSPNELPEGEYIVRGREKSRKEHWNDEMFAPTADKALAMAEPTWVIREYIPLVSYGNHYNGLPISREFRFFIYDGEIIFHNFYFSEYADILPEADVEVPQDCAFLLFLDKVITDCKNAGMNFFSLDVAQDVDGKWWVVEVNSGHRSGVPNLSADDYDYFYSRLYGKVIKNAKFK